MPSLEHSIEKGMCLAVQQSLKRDAVSFELCPLLDISALTVCMLMLHAHIKNRAMYI